MEGTSESEEATCSISITVPKHSFFMELFST